MQEELITPENLTKELLKSVFDAAFMETSYDEDGDLRIKDRVHCWVLPSERKDRIHLLANFGFKPESRMQRRLEFVNEVNRQYIIVRATVGKNDFLRFTYDILVSGGITKKALVLAVKRFCGIPHQAVNELGDDIVE